MLDKLEKVVRRFETLTERLADPSIYERQKELKEVSEERSGIEELVNTYIEYKKIKDDLEGAKGMLTTESDETMREMAKDEISQNEKVIEELEKKIRFLLLPQDPLDNKNVMLEIRAGAGGDEASIFVADVLRMYLNYFKQIGFRSDVVSISQGDQGIKEVILSVTGDKVYSKLKFESGVHRVQRVPKTEAQGRVHTSTITVAVLPEADEIDFVLNLNEVRIDVYRSGGSGGQSVNTTDSAVRVTHIPTGTVVAIQDEKSQHKNKEKALKILTNRLYDSLVQTQNDKEAAERRGLVGKGDRSERIRTYNFPQGRLTDHRIGLTLYSLDRIINGELTDVTEALVAYHQAELLKGEEQ
jgi:peptide chain release factor 1